MEQMFQKTNNMKKLIFAASLLATLAVSYAFIAPNNAPVASVAEEEIKWYSWEEAIAKMEESPKKLFVDVYTDWCGWCKRMDATTFKEPKVVQYMNENFYAVKLDAEQKEDIEYDGKTLKFIDSGRRGVHELAYALLNGRLSYPSYVYLDEEQRRITISPGYKPADTMIKELKWISEDHFKDTPYKEYMNKADGEK